MKYGNMAKIFQFTKGADGTPEREDAKWLTEGEKAKFADGQFQKFLDALAAHRESTRNKLVKKGVISE
jgi:hypothetical protein